MKLRLGPRPPGRRHGPMTDRSSGLGARRRSNSACASATAPCDFFGAGERGRQPAGFPRPPCGSRSRRRHALQREGAAGSVPAAGRAGGRTGHAGPQEGQRGEATAGEAGGQFPLLLPDGRGRARRSLAAGALQNRPGRALRLLHQLRGGP